MIGLKSSKRISASLTILLCAFASSAGKAEVTVELQSGRLFTGQVGAGSDSDNLWLRTTSDAITIDRPIAWSQIVAAQQAGRQIAVASLRDEAASLAVADEPSTSWTDQMPRDAAAAVADRFVGQPSIESNRRPTSIELDAYLANWDADVEMDGLIVRVTALSSAGNIVPAFGTLQVDWVATRPVGLVTRNYRVGRDLGPGFLLAGRWTRQLTPATTGRDVAEYRLPFQADHPEFDLDLGSFGVINARLAVPGVGVLNASDAMVRVRPMSTVRDARARLDRVWFFPVERTGRRE